LAVEAISIYIFSILLEVRPEKKERDKESAGRRNRPAEEKREALLLFKD